MTDATETKTDASMPSTVSGVRLNEMGAFGLKRRDGVILEEPNKCLRYPQNLKTFKVMSRDPSIASALNLIEVMIRKVDWCVVPPRGKESDTEAWNVYADKIKFFEQCMHDMEDTWEDFISDVLSMLIYGYSVQEKVYKYRLGNSGKYPSRYNDGLIGWAKLPIRSQDTIDKWYFDKKGRKLVGCRQNLTGIADNDFYSILDQEKLKIRLPRKKFMLFRINPKRGNPEGRSPLISAYVPWKYKTTIEEYEAVGISRDLAGMPVIKLPPEYFASELDAEKASFMEYCTKVINNMNANRQAGLVFPKYIDPESRQDIFDFSLVGVTGGKNYDTDKVITRYESQILMSFLADVLKLGQGANGSFALADSKTNTLAMSIESILRQIKSVLNRDLVAQTYALNGWDAEEMVQIDHKKLQDDDIDNLSKFIQRCVSVGALEVDRDLSSWLRGRIGAPTVNENNPVNEDLLPNSQSKSGEGMKTAGQGTAKNPTGGDTSTSNKEK